MSCLVIALAMVIVVVAVASSSGYEVIDTGGMAIPEHYRALTRAPLCSALVEKHLTLQVKNCEAMLKGGISTGIKLSIAIRIQRML